MENFRVALGLVLLEHKHGFVRHSAKGIAVSSVGWLGGLGGWPSIDLLVFVWHFILPSCGYISYGITYVIDR